MSITPRIEGDSWTFRYRFVEARRNDLGVQQDVGATSPQCEDVSGGRIEWRRADAIEESYSNDERGIEQAFVLSHRPPGDVTQPVVLSGSIEGLLAYPAADHQSVLLRASSGADVLRLHDLLVTDATGKQLAAWFAVGPRTLDVVVDDRGAVYPVTVDPILSSPSSVVEGHKAYMYFGWSVATAGDVNGDGYSDVVVGAPEYEYAFTGEGAAFVFLGSASGLTSPPDWGAMGGQAHADFGFSVATAGDVNADGYSDVIIGVDHYDGGSGKRGRAVVYHGSSSGLATSPAWTVNGEGAFGSSVATAGDVNGDTYSDVIVGAPLTKVELVDEGKAFVYYGSATGVESTPSWTSRGGFTGIEFGAAVATAGDVDGDGLSDVIVGAPFFSHGETREGRAYVFHGSGTHISATAAWTVESNEASAAFGTSVATAGDVNGDGYADVVVGAPGHSGSYTEEGSALIFLGSSSGLDTSTSWMAEGGQDYANFGISVSTCGDVNDDGYGDVAVGAWGFDNGTSAQGRAYVFQGSASGLAATPDWYEDGAVSQSSLFGGSVALAGDVNGDGYSDIVVGAPEFTDTDTDEGSATVFYGSPLGLAAAPAWSAESDQANAQMGFSVATVGDVNGDGYSDVIVGAPYYDNGEAYEGSVFAYYGRPEGLPTAPDWVEESDQAGAHLGSSVGTAGDVNGDGFADAIVGVPLWDNGTAINEGTAFVYLGSASGLVTTGPDWSADGGMAGDHIGFSVASGGDFNGDGYSDVIVGAPDANSLDGMAQVFLGSTIGLAATPLANLSDGAGSAFGTSVAAADVNGDGYSDVIVGAPLHPSNERGEVDVFQGGPSVVPLLPTWSLPGDTDGEHLGSSVASAGDVNGDGYSDVIAGAPDYTSTLTAQGVAQLYLGSASGPAASWARKGDEGYSHSGTSVASAGDVNGDGYSDWIVVEPGYSSYDGRALLYLGSSTVPGTTDAWSYVGDAVGGLGPAATAGDVNGDGYSDVIVGTPYYSNGEGNEGGAWLFYGNGGDGLDRIPRQRTYDDLAPIGPLGLIHYSFGFLVAANGRSPFGRGQVRLEAETEAQGDPFGTNLPAIGAWVDTGSPGATGSVVSLAVALGRAGPSGTAQRWRVRLRTAGPFPWQSHWMSIPDNCQSETDVRVP